MSQTWTHFIRSAYRKQPVFSFMATIGAVNAIIGGMDGEWVLLSLGIGAMGIALALRWVQPQRRRIQPIDRTPIRYLPAQSSRPSLPLLTPTQKRG